MKNIVIKVYTRKEIVGFARENWAYVEQNSARKNLTDFGCFCLEEAEKRCKKYDDLLRRFPHSMEFAFKGGKLVSFIIKEV